MAEQCCVCDEKGENQCPNEAKWQTWDPTRRYDETFNDYCDDHLIDGMRESGRTTVWEIELVRGAPEEVVKTIAERTIKTVAARAVMIDGEAIDCSTLEFRRYRKLPVVIEAVRIDEPFEVATLEGTHRGSPGDYLIRGVEGELYPCKPGIFAKTYEYARG